MPVTEWWAFGCVAYDLYTKDSSSVLFPSARHKMCPKWIAQQLGYGVPYSEFHRSLLQSYFRAVPGDRTSGASTIKLFEVQGPQLF